MNNRKLKQYSIRKITLAVYLLEKVEGKTWFTYKEISNGTTLEDIGIIAKRISNFGKIYSTFKRRKIPEALTKKGGSYVMCSLTENGRKRARWYLQHNYEWVSELFHYDIVPKPED